MSKQELITELMGALEKIAKGNIPPGFSLEGSREGFHERFSCWMQKVAREAIAEHNAAKHEKPTQAARINTAQTCMHGFREGRICTICGG